MILNGNNYSTTINNVDNITCLFEEIMAARDVSYLPGLKLETSGKGDQCPLSMQKLIICAHCYLTTTCKG